MFHNDIYIMMNQQPEIINCTSIDKEEPHYTLGEFCLDCKGYFKENEDCECDKVDECLAHNPYYCNEGCGVIVGNSKQDDCERICNDCKEPEPDPIIISNKKFDITAMDNALNKDGVDWTYYKPTEKGTYSTVYIIDYIKDDTDEETDEEEDKDQYLMECENKCGKCLYIDTSIMCYTDPKGFDYTLCRECYFDCNYYEDDMNPDNKEEIEEYREHIYRGEPIVCETIDCSKTTYRDEQGENWNYEYMAYCWECRKDF